MNEALAGNDWPCGPITLTPARRLRLFTLASSIASGVVQASLRLGWLAPSPGRVVASAPVLNGLEVVHKSTSTHQPRGFREAAVGNSGDIFSEFQRLIAPQLDAAYSFARFLVRDADAAQDIAQEAFLRAYRGLHTYRGGEPRAWLFAIVRHCFHDWQIERRRRQRFESDLDIGGKGEDEDGSSGADHASEDDTPETALIRKTESEAVRTVLCGLPRPLREVLVLRELEELSYREIAAVTALPIGTVMSRLARARRAMSEAWQRRVASQDDER
ncbi:MAG TPA: sigma-70 family RNA polymerase sigma factor [Sphingomicrobium sp.]|nr:sigma-70 family RNA polymerase sigma factor [Sphingomicrobium sp.]